MLVLTPRRANAADKTTGKGVDWACSSVRYGARAEARLEALDEHTIRVEDAKL